jgi:hypothetical protein
MLHPSNKNGATEKTTPEATPAPAKKSWTDYAYYWVCCEASLPTYSVLFSLTDNKESAGNTTVPTTISGPVSDARTASMSNAIRTLGVNISRRARNERSRW